MSDEFDVTTRNAPPAGEVCVYFAVNERSRAGAADNGKAFAGV
jgi:hypothetical protein